MSEHVLVRDDGRVRVVTLNRPEKKNALTQAMYAAIAGAIETADASQSVRVLVITGAGDSFTAGNDITDFATGMGEGDPPVKRFLRAIASCDTPVIIAVNGPAVGVGLTMLLHADLSFASASATFKAPFVQLGLVPEAASSLLLPATVGMALANDLFFTGRTLTAQEGQAAGLVSRVFPGEALLPETMSVAREVAAQAPGAMRDAKRLVRSGRTAIAERMAAEEAIFVARLASAEFLEAASAFMQRRQPEFD